VVRPNGLGLSTLSVSTAGNVKVCGSRLRHHTVGVGLWARNSLGSGTCLFLLYGKNLFAVSINTNLAKVFLHNQASRPNVRSASARRDKLLSGAIVAGGGTMRVRYQRGYLRLGQRKKGPDRWEFLRWDSEPTGVRVRRKAVIGTVLQYPNLENAWQASNGLRVSINETRNRQRENHSR
jgi:hypothetical protein